MCIKHHNKYEAKKYVSKVTPEQRSKLTLQWGKSLFQNVFGHFFSFEEINTLIQQGQIKLTKTKNVKQHNFFNIDNNRKSFLSNKSAY